ncbi:transferase, LpxA family [Cellulophaga algicola DSM 14237]|uniref:Transferase, LpxA family n=1 Tax=Cellulophaga algicola (strain DSM 14237 / IC166 / ACAM 630) TaxID=688270 RepID=E6X944_CELAD|nr:MULTISPECIES: DapH/DapD/GlmU-related protein [Cellulophaga]ADV50854.1 transferase, LpxA family [Cellulophaga algicola DSM 14237]
MEQKIAIKDFIATISEHFEAVQHLAPWDITNNLKAIIEEILPKLGADFTIADGIAIHKTTVIETGVTIKSPFIAMENCHLGANSYFREGVFLDRSVKIGPCSEIKSSIIGTKTAIAHLNYIGNSIIGEQVNFEAGSIAANHYNEREDKTIWVTYHDAIIATGVEKFGALVGDNSRIGANGVLSPGTILKKNAIVKRLELIEQLKQK